MTFLSDPDEPLLPPKDTDSSNIVTDEPITQAPPDVVTPVQEVITNPPPVHFEDMTLAEVVAQVFHAPAYTLRSLRQVISTPNEEQVREVGGFSEQRAAIWRPIRNASTIGKPLSDAEQIVRQRDVFLLSTRIVAFLVTVYGNWIMATDRTEATGLASGIPFLLAGFCVWIAGDVISGRSMRQEQRTESAQEIDVLPIVAFPSLKLDFDFLPLTLRFFGTALALTMSIITLSATSGNRFTTLGVVAWIASIALWVIVFAPREWGVAAFMTSVRQTRLPHGWTLVLLIGIILVAALFRFTRLSSIPSEMTSDHVEKILDSQRILNGNPQVFFPNNGGREPIQFYLMAIISQIPEFGSEFFHTQILDRH